MLHTDSQASENMRSTAGRKEGKYWAPNPNNCTMK